MSVSDLGMEVEIIHKFHQILEEPHPRKLRATTLMYQSLFFTSLNKVSC
jgi:hypothetical protein